MQISVYNAALDSVGIVEKYRSLVYTRRYQAAGEAKLLAPYSEHHAQCLSIGNLLLLPGSTEAVGDLPLLQSRSEAVEIENVGITQNANGEELLEVTGRTLMCWLERRVTIKQLVSSAMTGQQLLALLLAQNATAPTNTKRKFPYASLYARPSYGDAPIADYASTEHAQLLDDVEALLASADLGFRVHTDVNAKTHQLDVYRGQDLTVEQSERNPCIFTMENGVLDTQSYTHDVQAYRTMGYVYGADKTVELNGELSGLMRREVAVAATDLAKTYTNDAGTEITRTDEQLTSALRQRGQEQLSQAGQEETMAADLGQNARVRYGVDYDLGDRVTCLNQRWGVALNARITEVTQVWQNQQISLSLVFGEGTPTLRRALRKTRIGG